MNILFDINHPAHVHLFRIAINRLTQKGHSIFITARDKEVTLELLQHYGLTYTLLTKAGKGLLGLAGELLLKQLKLIPFFLKNKIQLCVSVTGSLHAAKLFGIPSLIFHDSESAELQNAVTHPFADAIFTPDCYRLTHGKKHIRYPGFHELAYLHPHQFHPNPSLLKELGVAPAERFFVFRFVAWQASHDVGRFGFTREQKIQLIDFLKPLGKIFITSEKSLQPELEPFRIKLPADKLHDILFYAALLITDSQTVTTEAALLGTPPIRYNSCAGPGDVGNVIEREPRYDLIYSFNDFEKAFEKMKALIANPHSKQDWQKKRERLLQDKIDVSEWMEHAILHFRELKKDQRSPD